VAGGRLSDDPHSSEELDAVSTLATQAGSALTSARLSAESAVATDYLATILATMPSGVVAVSASEEVVLFNPAAAQLTGVSRPPVGARLAQLPPALAAALRLALHAPERRTYPELAVHATDATETATCIIAPVRDHAGAAVGAVAVFSDLGPRRELERERARAEQLAGFQVLTQSLAHEIANPLVPIKTMTQLLEKYSGRPGFVREFVRIVGRELERMEGLVARLRTGVRPQPPPATPVDLRTPVLAAAEVLAALASERGIGIHCELGEDPLVVNGDAAELEEVFLNLMKNSLEAIAPTASPVVGRVDVIAQRVNGHVVVRVRDTGPGVPASLLDRVFDPFVTTKPAGLGLGLAICAAIVHRSGGRIEAINAPAGGAAVSIDLPLA